MRASLKEIARQTAVDDKTVKRAILIAALAHGQGGYDLDDAMQAVRDHADPSLIAGHAINGRGEGGESGDAKPSATSTLANAKARGEIARADKIELELAVRRGQLVERDAVINVASDLIARVRTGLLTLGYRIAPQIAGLTDQQAIARIINDDIRLALRELADADRFTNEVLS